jgi:hypothetical protein
MPKARKYRAFYLPPSTWVAETVNLVYPPNGQPIAELGEIVYDYANDTFAMRISRDGMVMLDLLAFPEPSTNEGIDLQIQMLSAYVGHMNAFLVLLDTAIQKKEQEGYLDLSEVTRSDVCTVAYSEGQPVPAIAAGGFCTAFTRAMYRFAPPAASDHFWITPRRTISLASVESAVELFDKATRIDGLIGMLASLTKSVSEYKVGNYDLALVVSWFIVESTLRQLWRRTLGQIRHSDASSPPRVNADRLKQLTGNNYSIHSISNSLELMGVLPSELFHEISEVRQKRNKIAHFDGDYSATTQDAQQAILASAAAIDCYYAFDVTPNLGFSVSW